jgi:hypothetical protein
MQPSRVRPPRIALATDVVDNTLKDSFEVRKIRFGMEGKSTSRLRTLTTGAWGTLARRRRSADINGGQTAKTHGRSGIYVGRPATHCGQWGAGSSGFLLGLV